MIFVGIANPVQPFSFLLVAPGLFAPQHIIPGKVLRQCGNGPGQPLQPQLEFPERLHTDALAPAALPGMLLIWVDFMVGQSLRQRAGQTPLGFTTSSTMPPTSMSAPTAGGMK